jgi:hypothetical protein
MYNLPFKSNGESIVNIKKTVHTARTIMYTELSKVMDHAIQDDSYLDSLELNIANKKTKYNLTFTSLLMVKLYGFDTKNLPFIFFKYFWQITPKEDKPILALQYAIGRDFLLAESIGVVASTSFGEKVTIEKFEENIELHLPNRYSEKTKRSTAQNLASSWKQAGFITGKIKNIRTQPVVNFNVVAFAFLMAYLNGDRGDFIITSKWAKALGIGDGQLRSLAVEAAKRDLLQYQFAGSVTAISFNHLFNKLGIDGI